MFLRTNVLRIGAFSNNFEVSAELSARPIDSYVFIHVLSIAGVHGAAYDDDAYFSRALHLFQHVFNAFALNESDVLLVEWSNVSSRWSTL